MPTIHVDGILDLMRTTTTTTATASQEKDGDYCKCYSTQYNTKDGTAGQVVADSGIGAT
jgi:hypothetical protein